MKKVSVLINEFSKSDPNMTGIGLCITV